MFKDIHLCTALLRSRCSISVGLTLIRSFQTLYFFSFSLSDVYFMVYLVWLSCSITQFQTCLGCWTDGLAFVSRIFWCVTNEGFRRLKRRRRANSFICFYFHVHHSTLWFSASSLLCSLILRHMWQLEHTHSSVLDHEVGSLWLCSPGFLQAHIRHTLVNYKWLDTGETLHRLPAGSGCLLSLHSRHSVWSWLPHSIKWCSSLFPRSCGCKIKPDHHPSTIMLESWYKVLVVMHCVHDDQTSPPWPHLSKRYCSRTSGVCSDAVLQT